MLQITPTSQEPQAAAVAPVEQAPAPTPEAAKPPDDVSQKFAAMARKERMLRAEAQKIKAERDAWKAEQESQTNKYKNYIDREALKKDPLMILNELGVQPDQLAQMILNAPAQPDPKFNELLSRNKELEERLAKFENEYKEGQTKSYEQAVNQVRTEAKILIDSDPAYETIKDTGNTEAVVEHIKQTWDTDGILLTVEQAAKEVEDVLLEEAIKMASLKKVKQKLQPPVEEPKQQQVSKQQLRQQPIKTLTHDLTAPSSASTSLTAAQRKQRAILRAQGLDPDTGKPLGS